MNNEFTRSLKGIAFMIVGIFLYSSINLVVKDLASQDMFSVPQITFFRMFFAIFPALFMLRQTQRTNMFCTPSLRRLMVVGFGNFVAILLIFKSFEILPFAEAQTLCFTSIIFATLMAPFVLGERITFISGIAVFLGFVGIIGVAQPGAGSVNMYGVATALSFAFVDAITLVNLRILGQKNSGYKVAFYLMVFGSCYVLVLYGLAPYLPHEFVDLIALRWDGFTWLQFAKLASVGVVGGIGQICVSMAYAHARAVTVSPVIYTGVVWGLVFDAVLFGRNLTVSLVLGAVLVISSGLLIVWNERKMAQQT